MKCLWLVFVLPTVLAQVGFGKSYLKNSRLCHQWHCLNSKLGLADELPPKDQFSDVLKGLLPEGEWQRVAGRVLDICYGNRTRVYTNTCPGQALFHCVVDQMINNCVEDSWRRNDACSDVYSLAGLKYMFTQSLYENLEENLPKESRPAWFMHNYFDTKCCSLPELFNATTLGQCGFSGFINYYTHAPKYSTPEVVDKFKNHLRHGVPQNNGDTLHVVDLEQLQKSDDSTDPLDCCDISEFIEPSWRSECDFQLSWGGQNRLVIKNETAMFSTEPPMPTSTQGTKPIKDLILVPESCEKESCVFRKLNIVSGAGVVDKDAYLKMLDNFTDAHPTWTHAKARVVTKCLSKPRLSEYEADCEINRILACTFDVLTENCPYAKRSDACKHQKYKTGCQISSSKYRPKNRREICLLPELLNREYLSGCGLDSLRRAEHVTIEAPKPRKYNWSSSKYTCKDLTPSTICLMNKMGILNKYKFLNYFETKDRIRRFTQNQAEWALTEIYLSAFNNIPLYREHCSSSKKFLNVLDSMIMTCPVSKRKTTPQCAKIFAEISNTSPVNHNTSRHKHDEILEHFKNVFMPENAVTAGYSHVIRHRRPFVQRKPLYNYGILNSVAAPNVKIIDVEPKSTALPITATHLVLLPVYLRAPNNVQRPYNDGIFRSNPFSLHTRIAVAHNSTKTPVPFISTIPSTESFDSPIHNITTNINNGKNSSIEMMKP